MVTYVYISWGLGMDHGGDHEIETEVGMGINIYLLQNNFDGVYKKILPEMR